MNLRRLADRLQQSERSSGAIDHDGESGAQTVAIAEGCFEAGEAMVHLVDDGADIGSRDVDELVLLTQGAKRCGDKNARHRSQPHAANAIDRLQRS